MFQTPQAAALAAYPVPVALLPRQTRMARAYPLEVDWAALGGTEPTLGEIFQHDPAAGLAVLEAERLPFQISKVRLHRLLAIVAGRLLLDARVRPLTEASQKLSRAKQLAAGETIPWQPQHDPFHRQLQQRQLQRDQLRTLAADAASQAQGELESVTRQIALLKAFNIVLEHLHKLDMRLEHHAYVEGVCGILQAAQGTWVPENVMPGHHFLVTPEDASTFRATVGVLVLETYIQV